VRSIFEAIDGAVLIAATSALTLIEVLVVSYKTGNLSLAERYEALLTGSRGLRFVEIDRLLLKAAAELRAASNINPPDAIQIAAALVANCGAFLTNDRGIPAVPGLKILQLDKYLPPTRGRRSRKPE
jgi:predicted nucleic acid-binding protein